MARINDIPAVAKLGLFAVLAGAVYGGGWYFLLRDMQARNEGQRQQFVEARRRNQEMQGYVRRLSELEAQVALMQRQIEIQQRIVPDEKEAEGFIHVMQDTASAAGVTIRGYTPKPTVSREGYYEAPFDMQIDGPYYAVLNFFDRVAHLERLVSMDGLKVAGVHAPAGVPHQYAWGPNETVVVACQAKTYYRRTGTDAQGGKNAGK